MLKKKCPHCAKKIERKFSFCPYCGFPASKASEKEDFGLIGKDDLIKEMEASMPGMPPGIGKIMNSLMKQLDKELGGIGPGLNIQISTGKPQVRNQVQPVQPQVIEIDEKEFERRRNLPKQEAESNVRRFSDKIVYEIKVPGVRSKKDTLISRMENGFEIKAYSQDKCYFKIIPVKVEITKVQLKDEILFLELKD